MTYADVPNMRYEGTIRIVLKTGETLTISETGDDNRLNINSSSKVVLVPKSSNSIDLVV